MVTAEDIRAWAVLNGFPEVAGKRGRLPAAVHEAFRLKNKGPGATVGAGTPRQSAKPAVKNSAPVAKKSPCRSTITLPLGIQAKAIIADQDGLCSGCENPATEVVSTLDGQYPEDPIYWTALCGTCLCDWRKRVR